MTDARIDGRVFVLSGCASGIGLRLVERLAAAGARVVATDVDGDGLAARARERGWDAAQVATRRLDVRDADGWEQALDLAEQRHGPVDVLINVAGWIRPAYLTDVTDDDLHRQLDVNTKGTMLGTRAAARRMAARGRGHVINVCSLTGVAPTPGMTIYSASKFAIRGFSLGAAQELRPAGVHVTVVCPDGVDTPMAALEMQHPEAALTFSGRRLLTVDDVADAILGRVLRRRPLEVLLPAGRGALSLLAGTLPELAMRIEPGVIRTGEANRQRLLASRAEDGE